MSPRAVASALPNGEPIVNEFKLTAPESKLAPICNDIVVLEPFNNLIVLNDDEFANLVISFTRSSTSDLMAFLSAVPFVPLAA
ncbi:MAG: hypothetical protein MZV64_64955 [Ignavibacteriales bacterium]|nr:hypothetical protein [Ignavibacteriales bacterium]